MRFPFKLRNSLLTRVLALNLVLVLATGAIVTSITLFTFRRAFEQEMQLHASSLAKSLAARAQFAVLVGDRPQLARLGEEVFSNDEVLFLVITDKDGASYYRARSRAGAQVSGFTTGESASRLPDNDHLSTLHQYLETSRPIEAPDSADLSGMETRRADSAALGLLRIGISLEQPRAMVFSATAWALLVASFCVALILWLEFGQLRRLLAPLGKLAEFTAGVGQDSLDQRAEVGGADEVSALAAAFNGMLDRLAATLVSKELAEKASLAKTRFLATTGHELRTPLNAIIGYSEMLQEECEDRGLDYLMADLGKIRNSGRMLLDLMNDLLDYSKAEVGQMRFTLEDVSVAAVMDEVAATVEPMAWTNGNRLVIESPPATLAVRADHGRLRQSLLNLASNACKFTEQGTVTLAARTVAAADGERCEIQVRDTGIGISPRDIDKLFAAFVQLDDSQTRKYSGTGLGLAISQKFCRAMGGEIRVESQIGRGSTFTISLPCLPPPAQEPEAPAEMECEA